MAHFQIKKSIKTWGVFNVPQKQKGVVTHMKRIISIDHGKVERQMEWVGRMNNIRYSADNIVLNEFIYD